MSILEFCRLTFLGRIIGKRDTEYASQSDAVGVSYVVSEQRDGYSQSTH